MKKVKTSIISMIVCLSISITFILNISNASEIKSFSDVPSSSWAYSAIMDMTKRGLFAGTSTPKNGVGTFSPDTTMTRAQFITVISRLLYADQLSKYNGDKSVWYSPNYWTCVNNKLFSEKDFKFGELNTPMSRQEMSFVLTQTCKKMNKGTNNLIDKSSIPDYNKISKKYQESVLFAYTNGLLAGVDSKGTFSPNGILTRAQGATVLYRLLNLSSGTSSPNSLPSTEPEPKIPTPEDAVPEPSNGNIRTSAKNRSTVDLTNIQKGYVMVKCSSEKRIKVQISSNTSKEVYTYNLNHNNTYEVFPFSEGNGTYTIKVYEQTTGNKYAVVQSETIDVNMTDSMSPFLCANQYVNYNKNSAIVKKASELTKGANNTIDKVKVIYDFVVDYLSYDTAKASTVQSGYLPDVDQILSNKKGICFDYAAVMAGMLRSQGIPCRLVVGYAGTAYHAWISVYVENVGWIENYIHFDGTTWTLMDPTFVSSGKRSESIKAYVSNTKNYVKKYYY